MQPRTDPNPGKARHVDGGRLFHARGRQAQMLINFCFGIGGNILKKVHIKAVAANFLTGRPRSKAAAGRMSAAASLLLFFSSKTLTAAGTVWQRKHPQCVDLEFHH